MVINYVYLLSLFFVCLCPFVFVHWSNADTGHLRTNPRIFIFWSLSSFPHFCTFVVCLLRSTCWHQRALWETSSRSPSSSSSVTPRRTWPSSSSCCWPRSTSPAPTCTCRDPHPPSWSGWFSRGCWVCNTMSTPQSALLDWLVFCWVESSVECLRWPFEEMHKFKGCRQRTL